MSGSGKDGDKMEWMYKPSLLVNRDEYLLGRTIDKSFQLIESVEKTGEFNYANEVEKDLTPLSIFAPSKGPVDVINKIKEDPLYLIQKKEEEALKTLLKNPVKMKEMQKLNKLKNFNSQLNTSSSSSKSSKNSKKKKSKHKKKKSRKNTSSSSSSDSEDEGRNKFKSLDDIDRLISQKLNALKRGDEKEKKSEKKLEKYGKSSSSSYSSHRNNRSRSRSPSHKNRQRSRSKSSDRKTHNFSKIFKNPQNNSTSSINFAPSSSSSSSNFKKIEPKNDKKSAIIDKSEMEKKLKEMMENAKWRDEQRLKSVTKYRNEEKNEEEKLRSSAHDPNFITKQLASATSSVSVESRIKSNSYTIQRSSSSMNQNFAKR